jgi:hypothetical protein
MLSPSLCSKSTTLPAATEASAVEGRRKSSGGKYNNQKRKELAGKGCKERAALMLAIYNEDKDKAPCTFNSLYHPLYYQKSHPVSFHINNCFAGSTTASGKEIGDILNKGAFKCPKLNLCPSEMGNLGKT